jgi:hypothetical protein
VRWNGVAAGRLTGGVARKLYIHDCCSQAAPRNALKLVRGSRKQVSEIEEGVMAASKALW